MGSYEDQSRGRAQGLAQAKVLVCESNGSLRQAIRSGLKKLGILETIEASDFGKTRQAIELGGFDALILNADMEGRDTCGLLRELRLGHLGGDPFVVSIVLMAGSDSGRLRRAVDSGTDDLLLIPFPPDQLANRLDALKSRRKPFVVTHDYIGPDRRKAERTGSRGGVASPLVPPNPLAARAAGISPEQYARERSQALQTLRMERIKRLAAATEWECRRMMSTIAESGDTRDQLAQAFDKLDRLLDELAARGKTAHALALKLQVPANRISAIVA